MTEKTTKNVGRTIKFPREDYYEFVSYLEMEGKDFSKWVRLAMKKELEKYRTKQNSN